LIELNLLKVEQLGKKEGEDGGKRESIKINELSHIPSPFSRIWSKKKIKAL
jgi:hypothetical protein